MQTRIRESCNRSRMAADKTWQWLTGGGEMAGLVSSIDGSVSPLGPIASWPRSLRTTVSLCSGSSFPIPWGDAHTRIYSDGEGP